MFPKSTSGKIEIKDLLLPELADIFETGGEPKWRAAQVFAWIYQKAVQDFDKMTDLSASHREQIKQHFESFTPSLEEKLISGGGTQKFLFKLQDGLLIESVYIPAGRRKTICISTQVGCKFACVFCASGLGGFKRDLRPSEILEQILYLRDVLDLSLTNYVFMGMGEPLDNFKALSRAILVMNSEEGMKIAARRITVSTCGIIPGIIALKDLGMQINLSISLHAVRNELRSRLIPVNKKYPIEKLLKVCEEYIDAVGRMITLEYILLEGVNDSKMDAEELAKIARRLHAKINLIPYSPVQGLHFISPKKERIQNFKKILNEKQAKVTLRQSKGSDIQAACGQLAGHPSKL
ncbi:MAG: 23S rRNA (adenine(2503)-C(2))-methyltransferase RlmN [Candidatus Aminicenantes bacterium]|nr:23S rRNA (adenine(2503)-C(2))-methyltransferase RlmN [Candidatus Aminicenantes bacterium]